MLLLWPSLLLTLHCTFLTWPVTCQRPVFPGASDYFDQLNYEIVIAQLKQRILRGMNRSEPPHLNMASMHKSYIQTNSPRLVFLSSQAADLESKDVVSFRLSSCVSAHVLDVDNAFLVFYVRSTQHFRDPEMKKRRPGWNRKTNRYYKLMKKNARLKRRLQKCKHKLKRLNESVDEQVDTTGSSYQPYNLSNSGNSSITPDPPVNSTLDRHLESSTSDDLSRIHRVKVVVRVMNTTTNRKRKFAVKQIQVKSGMSVLVSVPVKYLRRIADTEDHTLSLQIVCRGCGQQAWIEGVYKRKRRQGKKMKPVEKVLNINRPILFIEMKNGTCTDQPLNSLAAESYSSTTE